MIGRMRRFWDSFRGGGDAAVTVPPMDGALRPNRKLEEAGAVLAVDQPDNLVRVADEVCFSSGNLLLALDPEAGHTREVRRFESAITALAATSDGVLAVGLDDGGVRIVGGESDGAVVDRLGGKPLVCPTALLFAPSGELFVAQGSQTRRPGEWKHDLMERGSSGSIWRVDVASGRSSAVAERLAWPYGLALAPDGAIAIAESWRHRIVLAGSMPTHPVLSDLPGYPARLSPASGGGYWLTIFAPRNQLIEFVQREPEFRRRMMSEIDPDHWAAPSLKPSSTFLEPLQGGAQKHLGMLKPWAPTRSYGLVVRLDAHFRPLASFHSRADGSRHGVMSCLEDNGILLVASKGGGEIVALETSGRAAAPAAEEVA